MPKSDPSKTLFINKSPKVWEIYQRVLAEAAELGRYDTEVKKTSIHLVRKSAFAGVHPKKEWLDLTLRTAEPLKHARVRNQEQVSRNRWHQDIRIADVSEIDDKLLGWMRAAYACASGDP